MSSISKVDKSANQAMSSRPEPATGLSRAMGAEDADTTADAVKTLA